MDYDDPQHMFQECMSEQCYEVQTGVSPERETSGTMRSEMRSGEDLRAKTPSEHSTEIRFRVVVESEAD